MVLSKGEKPTIESRNPRNVYQIGGLQVRFPYQPYGTQLAFMSRVISTLDRAQRDGRCHALLESPTVTGKSLSLLCSVLAWQESYKSRFPNGNLAHGRGSGLFIKTDTQPSGESVSVIVTNYSSVNQRLRKSFEGSKGVWCEEDGCVFNTIFCPFCNIPKTCLGVQIMATDSSNVRFLSKVSSDL